MLRVSMREIGMLDFSYFLGYALGDSHIQVADLSSAAFRIGLSAHNNSTTIGIDKLLAFGIDCEFC